MALFFLLLSLLFALAMAFAGLGYRIIYVSSIKRDYYMQYVRSARNVREVRHALRGKILDRRGVVLATTTQVIDLGIDPYATREQDYAKFTALAPLINVSEEVLTKAWTKESFMREGRMNKLRWKKIAGR